jgi:hypothetical protein
MNPTAIIINDKDRLRTTSLVPECEKEFALRFEKVAVGQYRISFRPTRV